MKLRKRSLHFVLALVVASLTLLFETAQRYSFPSLVAGQMESVQNFEQPLISDPGIGERLGLSDDLSGPSQTNGQGQRSTYQCRT